MRTKSLRRAVCLMTILSISTVAAGGGGCFNPKPGPDIIVADLNGSIMWGVEADRAAYSFGTTSCNIGDTVVQFDRATNRHPIITQDLFRITDNRLEQIGMSWAKHAFGAATGSLCCICDPPGDSQLLGLGCSDPYGAATNGDQDGLSGGAFGGLGPRSDINPFTGVYPFPYTQQGVSGTSTFKRLQVHVDKINPIVNAGATYFGVSQYVAPDDVEAGNHYNNVGWREIQVGDPQADAWFLNFVGGAFQEQTPIEAWRHFDSAVDISTADVPGDGRLQIGTRVVDLGDGTWMYIYAVYNMHVSRGLSGVSIPLHTDRIFTAESFTDVHYHSGELIDSGDWAASRHLASVDWIVPRPAPGMAENLIRWSTMYTFSFMTDAPPAAAEGPISVQIGGFGLPASILVDAPVPTAPPPPCYSDCSPAGRPNGVVNIDDILAVLNAISTQDLDCDVAPDNGNGTVGNGLINFDDLLEVVNTFGPCT